MKTMKALIIDDEAACAETLALLLKTHHQDVELLGCAHTFDDGLKLVRKHKEAFDLLFLNIQLQGGDGFSLLQNVSDIDFKVIFTSARDEHAFRAIKFSAIDYLLKPVYAPELAVALDRFRKLRSGILPRRTSDLRIKAISPGYHEKLAVSTANDIELVELGEVIYLESDNNYSTLHLDNRKLVSSKSIGYYENLLEGSKFFRVHNSYLINLKKIKRYIRGSSGIVEMNGGSKLPVSLRRKEELIRQLSLI